jgi:hypothetical protein
MLLLDQTRSSLEKQQVLAQTTQVGDDFHLQPALIPMAPGYEGMNVPIPTGAQAVPLADLHWDQNDEEDEWDPSYSGRAKKGQSQTSKLFPGDCSTTRP